MSAASQIFGRSAVALGRGHDDILVLKPMLIMVPGYADEVPPQKGDGLKIGGQQHSHEIHVRRQELIDEEVEAYAQVLEIMFQDSEASYRVLNYVDDRQQPTVKFLCVAA